MYERFYELRERPFALSPDPDYLYPSRVHREALDYLRYGLESHAGFVAITGEIGSGKTTLLQTLLRGLDSQTTVGRIVNTMLEPRELLETIMIDFGLDPAGRSKPLLLRDLAQYLVDQRLAGRLVLLVIDEAQNLSLGALEELRMLSNLETEKSKLLQILLVGQPNLRDKLLSPELEQLRQRITVSYHLSPLDPEETANYINHRLRRASVGTPLEFPREATDFIHARSRGIPRIINVICDAALVFGYAEERRQIDMALMRDVLVELETTGVLPARVPAPAPVGRRVAEAEPVQVPARVGQVAAVEPFAVSAPMPSLAASAPLAPSIPSAVPAPAAALAPSVSTALVGPSVALAPPELPAPPVRSAPPAAVTAPPAPAAAAASVAVSPIDPGPLVVDDREALRARAAQLDQREQALRQRERELADQRRVLAEEYRLLRVQRPTAPSPSIRVQVPASERPAASLFGPARQHATVWARVKRFMLGSASPAIEEN
jgi:putative secretion ATPase (PEP-CTERM system associated)